MLISDHDLQAVKDLRQKNLNIQAFNLAKSICPLEEWEGQGRSLKHLTLCPIWERPEEFSSVGKDAAPESGKASFSAHHMGKPISI